MSESTNTPEGPIPARTNRSNDAAPTRAKVQNSFAPGAVDVPLLAATMYTFMIRNIASDGFLFTDPQSPGDQSRDSKPGPGIDEDYVFNWVHDGAITAMEVAMADMLTRPSDTVQTLNDYVQFAELCHSNATPTKGHACFHIAGDSRPWTEQNDRPALQSITILAAYYQLDPAIQAANGHQPDGRGDARHPTRVRQEGSRLPRRRPGLVAIARRPWTSCQPERSRRPCLIRTVGRHAH